MRYKTTQGYGNRRDDKSGSADVAGMLTKAAIELWQMTTRSTYNSHCNDHQFVVGVSPEMDAE
jgi:hypothetical protein